MPIRPLTSVMVIIALVMPATAQTQYTFNPIATTGTGSGFAGLFPPQINQLGSVAFGATLTSGNTPNPQGIFVGTQGVVVPIAQNPVGSAFTGFNFPPGPIVAAINPGSNMTAFFASRTAAQGGGVGIFTSDSISTSTIAATGAGFTNFGIGVDINGSTPFNVAFTGSTATGQGVFIGAPGATPTTAASTAGGFFNSFSGAVAINNSGQTSFSAGKTAGGSGIFRFTPSTLATTPIAQSGGAFLGFGGPSDIDNSGRVAFLASLTAGGFGIFRGDGNVIDTIATSANGFTTFGDAPSINNLGNVVFAANLVGGGQGIFTGPNVITNKVIRTGDTLAGSTVVSVALASGAFNDLGQVAFAAALADGRQGVFVAIPVPEPASVLLIAGTALAAGGWWRRRRFPAS